MGEVLPYLELQKDKEEQTEIAGEVEVPEIRDMNLKEAKKVLKEIGLEIQTNIEITRWNEGRGNNNKRTITKAGNKG